MTAPYTNAEVMHWDARRKHFASQRRKAAIRARRAAEKAARREAHHVIAMLWHLAGQADPRSLPELVAHHRACQAAWAAHREAIGLPAQAGDPVVRVHFEHAMVLGHLGESLCYAESKNWGHFQHIEPLRPGDPAGGRRLLAAFKESNPYQKRFAQRERMRKKLGKQYAPLVTKAMRSRKTRFLDGLTPDEAARIPKRLGVDPGQFWRLARGVCFHYWPKPPVQMSLFETDTP